MNLKGFLKRGLPWILCAIIAVSLPIAIKIFGIGFDKIVFNKEYGGQTIAASPSPAAFPTPSTESEIMFILNTSSKRIHTADCRYVKNISESNKKSVVTDNADNEINDLESRGYALCGVCCKNYKSE